MQEAKKVLQQAKKTLLAVVMGGLLAMTLCAVTGCQDNSEEVIRQSLTEEIDEIKAMDDATVSEMASSMGYASTLAWASPLKSWCVRCFKGSMVLSIQ